MEFFIGFIVCAVLLYLWLSGSHIFDDPKPMENQRLMAAIAGQADWLEKMSSSPLASQQSVSIMELARKRREYIAQLCMEALSRANRDDGPKYPGATHSINVFSAAAEYAKELEGQGLSKGNAAVRAVKEKMFVPTGVIYPTRWEL